MNRVSPPSTGITYIRSADCSPACGLACTMLSIFTASTRPQLLDRLPGERGVEPGGVVRDRLAAWASGRENDSMASGGGLAGAAELASMAISDTAAPTATTPPPADSRGCRRSTGCDTSRRMPCLIARTASWLPAMTSPSRRSRSPVTRKAMRKQCGIWRFRDDACGKSGFCRERAVAASLTTFRPRVTC